MSLRLDPTLVQAIDRGATLLTPGQRAAHTIAVAWDERQRAQGQTLWTPARVQPLNQWLAGLWQRQILAGSETRVLLNSTQQHALWTEVIANDREAQGVRSPAALADLATRAWSLLWWHEAHGGLREARLSSDSRAFDRWARGFERRLARDQFITPAQLASALHPAAAEDLLLIDFDSHPPAIRHLLERLEESGSTIAHHQTGTGGPIVHLHAAASEDAELKAAALWIQQQRTRQPGLRLAVVVPNLADRRAQIERVFATTLDPVGTLITSASPAPVYEFSLGVPLSGLAVASTALALLEWPLAPLSLERISALLLSPWFMAGVAASSHAAACWDAFDLRQAKMLQPELSLEAAIQLLEDRSRSELHGLLHRLRSLRKAARDCGFAAIVPPQLSHAAWAEAFRRLLEQAGWTAHATSSSLAFQQHRRFESALDEFATLDFDGRIVMPNQALAALTRILSQTIFAPESHDAPVQILGPLEAGGVAFDALWFLGVDDLGWPAPALPSPLLPWPLQRAAGMPGADRAQDDANARALTRRIAHAATELVFSYAQRDEEGERRPSRLLEELALAPLPLPAPAPEQPLALEVVPEDATLPPLPEGIVPGGAGVLQLQAACGFRAFAERRLFSKPLATREPGFDALERGNLVHQVMQTFWTSLRTQAALLALSAEERKTLLDQAIGTAMAKLDPGSLSLSPWNEAYLRIQQQRLQDLLTPWIGTEALRAPFSVRPPEQDQTFQLGPLPLRLRVDRIDETPGGGLVILDYKTGAATPAHWQGERPDAPQLPLYAVMAQAQGERVDALAFALLRAGNDLGLKGFSEDVSLLPKPAKMQAPSLAEQIEQWSEILTRLAEDFAAGDVRVLPKLHPKTCEYCHQRILCRLDAAALEAAPDENTDAEPVRG